MGPATAHPEIELSGQETDDAALARRRWNAWEMVIAFFVISHFAVGLLSTLPQRSKIWGIPVFRVFGSFYRNNRFDQSWGMFSPPPNMRESIQYSLHLPGGWSGLISPSSVPLEQVQRGLVQPRGMFRLVSFLRARASDKTPDGLNERSSRALYYQQLSDYFCRGDGRIVGIIGIRFYLVGKGVPDFFDRGKYGEPLPPISDFDFQLPLYEQKCANP
jgi:hypothetical protein